MSWVNDNDGFQEWKTGADSWWDDEHQAVVYEDWQLRAVRFGLDGSVHIDADRFGSTDWFGSVLARGDVR